MNKFVVLCLACGLLGLPVGGHADDYYENGNGSDAQEQSQDQSQHQDQFQFQDQHQGQNQSNVGIVNDGDVTLEAADLSQAPGTPGSVYVDSCSNAGSLSGHGFGFTSGSGSVFCSKLALANAYRAAGMEASSVALLASAENDLKRQNFVVRFLDWVPILRNIL